MDNYLNLTKVFLKNIKMSKSNNKRTRITFNILLIFTILFIIIPFLLISAIFVYDTTLKLLDINYESIGLQIMCYIVSIFTFIFSFQVILNEFYFSNDIEKILPLPIKPIELISSKFTTCFIVENVIQILLILVSIISYVLALNLNISNILLSLIQIITLPIIPMIYSSIICLIVMYFTKFIKNKENIKKLSSLFIVFLFVLFYLLIGTLKNFNFELYLENFANGNHKFLNIMNIIFPHIKLFTNTITNKDILSLILYIILNIIYLSVFLILSKYIYIDSVIGMTSKDTSINKSSTKLLNNLKEKNIIISYISKEIKILFRTPTFFINCIVINILWPIFIYALYQIGSIDYSINDIRKLLLENNDNIKIILLLLISGISILLPAMNSISSTSFSREGKHFQFMKYIPVSYKKQWLVKYLVSFIITFIGVNFYTTIFYILVNLNIKIVILFYIVSILSISAISLIGILIDSVQPKLIWDDENNALRENYNTFISMAIAIMIFGLIIGGTYFYLQKKLLMSFNQISFILLLVLLILNLILIIISIQSGTKNIIEQEET